MMTTTMVTTTMVTTMMMTTMMMTSIGLGFRVSGLGFVFLGFRGSGGSGFRVYEFPTKYCDKLFSVFFEDDQARI